MSPSRSRSTRTAARSSRPTAPSAPATTMSDGSTARSLALRGRRGGTMAEMGGEQAAALRGVPGGSSTPMIVQAAFDPATTASQASMFSAEDSPVRTSAWRDAVLAWLASDPGYGTNSVASLLNSLPAGFSSRTSLGCFPAIEGETLPSSFRGWSNSGMAWRGGCLTLNTSEFPSDAVVSSLSDVLETGPHLARYSLSPKACRGILRRAAKRGKVLPPPLAAALASVAGPPTPTE
jgi:hypothetical protein